jgi:hypothetical protein
MKKQLSTLLLFLLSMACSWAQCPNKPNAGPDQFTCNSKIDLPDAVGTQKWSVLPGTWSAKIETFSGLASELSPGGNYFLLNDTVNLACSDTVLVGRILPSSINFSAVGDTVCSSKDSVEVTVTTGIGQIVDFFLGVTNIGGGIQTSFTKLYKVPTSAFPIGANTVVAKTTFTVCDQVIQLADDASVVINPSPPQIDIEAIGDTVCTNAASAVVTVVGVPVGVVVQATSIGNTMLGSPVVSLGGITSISIPVASLFVGLNKIVVKGTVAGCGVQEFSDTADILVNKLPNALLPIRGDTVIEEDMYVYVYVMNTELGVSYQPVLANIVIGVPQLGNGGTLVFALSVENLRVGNNSIVFTASIPGCATVLLNDTANVGVQSFVTSVDRNTSNSALQVWPNPVGSQLSIRVPSMGEKIKVSLRNSLGTIVHEETFTNQDITLSTDFPSGVYHLLVETSGKKFSKMVVRE